MGRNTAVLTEVIHALSNELDDPKYALDQLESHFHDTLLVNAGNLQLASPRPVSPVLPAFTLGVTQKYCADNIGCLRNQ